MKLTCTKSDFLEGLTIVSKAISNRTTLPILECILIETSKDTIKLMGNDLQLGIISNVKANIEKEGSIALESKILIEIIRKLSDDIITIEKNDKNIVTIKSGKSEFKIMGYDTTEYPKPVLIDKKNEIILFQSELKDMIKQTIFSISLNESKPILTGELFEIENNIFKLVAIDGYRISYREKQIDSNENVKVVIPGKTMIELTKILSSDVDEKVKINYNDKHIIFNIGHSIIISRLLEGEFLDYKQIFKEEEKIKLEVNKKEILESIERASLVSTIGNKEPIIIDILDSNMIITSNTSLGSSHEELLINRQNGENLKIAFNPKYLIDALRVIEDDQIIINYSSSLSPCLILPKNENKYKYLILPVRLN